MQDVQRRAETLLWGSGGRSVLLRMPLPPVAGDEGEVLGFATPTFHDVALQPAVFRKAGSTETLLIAAQAVDKAAAALAMEAAAMFAAAAGIVVDGETYRVGAVVAEQAFGTAYCYAVTLIAAGE